MKNNLFLFEIISIDGKKMSCEISELNVKTPSGMIGILKNHYPLISFIDISTFNIVVNNKRGYYAVSGGVLNVKKEKVVILCDTFESETEIDKDRQLQKKEIAIDILNNTTKYDSLDLARAERSLKKAINRLSLIK